MQHSFRIKKTIYIAFAIGIISACASPARYDWTKEGASKHQRINDSSECTYQVRLNKTPAMERTQLHNLCMQGKGYRLRRVN